MSKEKFHVESSHDVVDWSSDEGTEIEASATESVRILNWIEPFMAWRLTKRVDNKIIAIGELIWTAKGFDGIKWIEPETEKAQQ